MTGTGDAVRRYQEISAIFADKKSAGSKDHPNFSPMDPANKPEPFKEYVGLPVVPLPTDVGVGQLSAAATLAGKPASGAAKLDSRLLARLLFHAAGVTRHGQKDGRLTYFRAAPAAGNLHPIEIYAVCAGIDGVDDGVHHFAPKAFGLVPLRAGDCRPALAEALVAPEAAGGQLYLILTGIPWRTSWKYRERGLRHIYWDAGAILANLLAVTGSAGLPTQVLTGFIDSSVSHLVGVDDTREFPVAVVAVGSTPGGLERGTASSVELPHILAPTKPMSPRPWDFPSIASPQQAGGLASAQDVLRWRAAAATAGQPTTFGAVAPAAAAGLVEESVESLILRRGSTRLMRRESVPREAFAWVLAVASQPLPCDFLPSGSTLLDLELSVHAVTDLPPGRYHWTAGELVAHELTTENEARARAQRLCLDQPLGGDSAFTAFLCVELEPLLTALGDRGYRVAQLEAGWVVGRLQLAAFAAGLGGTGLTFYDDAVSTAFETSAIGVLVASIGVPDYRSTPGGGPGAPVELVHQGKLMDRLMNRLRAPKPADT